MTSDTFITLSRLDSRLYLPFCLPETRLAFDTAQPLAFVALKLGQRLRLAWLELHLIRVLGDPLVAPTKINQAMAGVYTGLYGSQANRILEPTGQPLVYVPCELPGTNLADPIFYEDISAPDVYSILVVNNFQDAEVDVAVTGAFRLETI